MVYNGKTLLKRMIWGKTHHFGNTHTPPSEKFQARWVASCLPWEYGKHRESWWKLFRSNMRRAEAETFYRPPKFKSSQPSILLMEEIPVDMANTSLFTGFYTSQVVGNGISEPSTVVGPRLLAVPTTRVETFSRDLRSTIHDQRTRVQVEVPSRQQ